MKISYNWLQEHLPVDLSPDEISEILTSTGLEVESLEKTESIKGGLEGLVIGEVVEKEKHPDADKLSVAKVNVGNGDLFTIVCGAPNVAKGQKVIVALPGIILHPMNGDSFKIKKSKIRGIESNGMICAENEIGIGNDHNGIIVLDNSVKTGMPAKEYYNIKSDYVFEIGLTPNRIDAASHFGVARDLRAALIQRKNKTIDLKKQETEISFADKKIVSVSIESDDCKRYSSVVIENIKVEESPEWLKEKLTMIGLRPINNVVDITNYVLHDLGHPLHAFDASHIKGNKAIVRKAKAGTKFVTLDGVERNLDGSELMICNESEEMCIAGILGGEKSGVTEKTTSVFLESAWFDPSSIRKTAKKFGINSDASFRFERGADINNTLPALKLAAKLICEICGGKIASSLDDQYPEIIPANEITVSINSMNRIIGKNLDKNTIASILGTLDFKLLNNTNDELKLAIPSYRVDVTRECDVVEEILRIYGYNEIPLPEKMTGSVSFSKKPDHDIELTRISDFLSSLGFHEIMTNSLTSSSQMNLLNNGENKKEAVELLNPLSNELNIMRCSLLLNGLHTIAYNNNRQQHDLKFFESGKIYLKNNSGYIESYFISLFVTGRKTGENWNSGKENVSVYTIISAVDAIFKKFGIEKKISRQNGQHELFNEAVEYKSGKQIIATAGKFNNPSLKFADVKQDVYGAEINWDILMEALKKIKIQFEDLPKFPSVRRDLSLLLDEKVKFSEIETLARKTNSKLIKEVGLFDVYEGKNLEAGKKSYAVSFILYNEEATLTDSEVDKVMNEIIQSLDKNLGAKLR